MKLLSYYQLHVFCHVEVFFDLISCFFGCLIVNFLGGNSNTLLVCVLFASLVYLYFAIVVVKLSEVFEALIKELESPRYRLTSQDKRIIKSEIIPYIKQNFQRVILISMIYEIVSGFFIYLYSTPPVIFYAFIDVLIGNTSGSYSFVWKFYLLLFKILVTFAIQIVAAKSLTKERQRQCWNFLNFLAIVLYIIDISYQFTISFSFVVVSIVVFISAFFFFKRSVSKYIAASLIILFLVFNIVWYELWTVELFSMPVAKFLSQFTIVGSLLYTVGLNYPKFYVFFLVWYCNALLSGFWIS